MQLGPGNTRPFTSFTAILENGIIKPKRVPQSFFRERRGSRQGRPLGRRPGGHADPAEHVLGLNLLGFVLFCIETSGNGPPSHRK